MTSVSVAESFLVVWRLFDIVALRFEAELAGHLLRGHIRVAQCRG